MIDHGDQGFSLVYRGIQGVSESHFKGNGGREFLGIDFFVVYFLTSCFVGVFFGGGRSNSFNSVTIFWVK